MTDRQNSFPRWWHGIFVMILGAGLAVLKGAGLLGPLKGDERDLDRVVFLFLGGVLLGSILLAWSAILSVKRRKSTRNRS